jgi:sensor domain CHASE-containing protein
MTSGSFIFPHGLACSLLVPCAEEAAEDDEFAGVVGGVVGDEERFAEQVLAGAPEEGFGEVGFRGGG